MNKYIVAHFSLHTGSLLQEEVEAASMFEALKSYLEYPDDLTQTLEGIYDYCERTDQWVNAHMVSSFKPSKRTGTTEFGPLSALIH